MFIPEGTKVVDEDGRHICTCKGVEALGAANLLRDFDDWQIEPPIAGEEMPRDVESWHVAIPLGRTPQATQSGRLVIPYGQFIRLETGWFPEEPRLSDAFESRHYFAGGPYAFRLPGPDVA